MKHRIKNFKFRCHTGPTLVRHIAKKMTARGIDANAGTEHVYGSVKATTKDNALARLDAAAGRGIVSYRDVKSQ